MAIGGRDASNVFAVGIGPFIVHTIDHGRTWQAVTHGITDGTFYDVVSAPPDLFVTGLRREPSTTSSLGYHTVAVILRSSDGGVSWTSITPPVPGMSENEETRHVCFTSSGKMFVAMSYSVYSSSDRGRTWVNATSVGTEVLGLACSGREILVAARNRKFLDSKDDGATFGEHELDGVLTGRELIALEAAFISNDGAAYVGGEAYTSSGAGTFLRRTH